jgi:hypothetical protein
VKWTLLSRQYFHNLRYIIVAVPVCPVKDKLKSVAKLWATSFWGRNRWCAPDVVHLGWFDDDGYGDHVFNDTIGPGVGIGPAHVAHSDTTKQPRHY